MTVLTAANALRNFVAFRNTSLRHLADFVEQARGHVKGIPVDETGKVSGVFLLVLSGRGVAESVLPLAPGQTLWTGLVDLLRWARRGGARLTARSRQTSFTFTLQDVLDVKMTSTTEDLLVLPITLDLLQKATEASTSFGMSVSLAELLNRNRPFTLLDFFRNHTVSPGPTSPPGEPGPSGSQAPPGEPRPSREQAPSGEQGLSREPDRVI